MIRPHPWATAAFATSLAGAGFWGEVFPFSRYTMYADLEPRERGFLPVFLADGVEAEPRAYTAFSGLRPADLAPPEGVVGSLDYVVRERAAWIGAHPGPPHETGPVHVAVGYDLVWVEGDELVRERHLVAEGSAWR